MQLKTNALIVVVLLIRYKKYALYANHLLYLVGEIKDSANLPANRNFTECLRNKFTLTNKKGSQNY